MTETDAPPDLPAPRPRLRARAALLKRLTDVVCLPSSRVNVFERAMTADVLCDMLREASVADRERAARRLAILTEGPPALLRMLLRDEPEVARRLIEESGALSDADLLDCIATAGPEHRRLIALRQNLSEVVTDALIAKGEVAVIAALLRNTSARLSPTGIETVVALSRNDGRFVPLLLRRAELRPSHAYVLFWWADQEARTQILQRFAVSREVLQEAVTDVFSLAAEEGWQDPVARKILQFIERRQRNRLALERSPFESLEAAVLAAQDGMTRELAEEISFLAGVKPMTGMKILTDVGGEPIAILCKATGLRRSAVRALWRGLRRPETDPDGQPNPLLERVLLTYDILAVDRAQTVLRYWNWALSSALTPELLRAIRDGDDEALDAYSIPQRSAMLALGQDFGR